MTIEPGVSLALAQQRAELLRNIRYQLHLSIPGDPKAPILGRVVIEFYLSNNQHPLQLDFQQTAEHLLSVGNAAGSIDYDFKAEHLVIPSSALAQGANRLEIEFIAGDNSLNRNPNYLYTLFVPDRARTAFPLFDQPDLKARYQLTLEVPANWEAISNAPLNAKQTDEQRASYRFDTSELTSSYLFSFVAGQFQRVSREVNGRSISMLHRETDGDKLSRNLDAIFELHSDSLKWLESYTGIPYPFAKFDFALIPSFQYGGMEHPGAIQYRASSLLLNESPTQSQLLNRAGLIAHETAHMWFGNLVTMKWFNDVWTKEVFANFMAAKIVNPSFPDINHQLNFLVRHYPDAYQVERSAGANPIRQQLANLNQAGQMYGPIIYEKAPIMMRQLELIVGESSFRTGMQKYLAKFAFGNATWPDLISILDELSDQDLRAWSNVWVNTAGRPHFEIRTSAQQQAVLIQNDPANLGRNWPQQFSAVLTSGTQIIDSSKSETPLSATALQLNTDGFGYGLFPVAAKQLNDQGTSDELSRGALLIDTWENFLNGDLLAADQYAEVLLARITTEDNPLILEQALSQLGRVHASFLTANEQANIQKKMEDALRNELQATTDTGRARLFFNSLSALTSTADGLAYIRDLWAGNKDLETLPLAETDLIHLAELLALRQPMDAALILASQRKKIENPDSIRRFDFVAPALSADSKVRDAFFNSLKKPENRTTESWVLDALAYLHHPSRVAQSEKYIRPSLEILEEIQVTGDIFFPSRWVSTTLINYRSEAAVRVVTDFLAEQPDYNPQLRMKILQAVDMAQRASQYSGQKISS
ncbi:MAG: M1 family aminopeptidase [Halioglobus sp.]